MTNTNLQALEAELKQLREENKKLKMELKSYEDLNESLHSNIFENISAILLLIDQASGNIVEVNDAALQFYGYTKQEITKMNIKEIDGLTKEQRDRKVGKNREDNQGKFYVQHRIKSGELRDVEAIGGVVNISGRDYIYGIIEDVTDKNKKLQLLNESEKKFKELFNNINDAIYFLKIGEDGKMGNFLEVNTKGYTRLGYTYEEILHMSAKDISVLDEETLQELVYKVRREGKVTFESTHITKSGQHIPVDVITNEFDFSGEKATIIVARDITERKRFEKSLKENAEKQEKIISFLPDAVFLVDQEENGKIQFVNDFGVKLLGYESPDELIGEQYIDIVHPDFKAIVKERCSKLKYEQNLVGLSEIKYANKNGEEVNVETTGLKIPYEEGHVVLVVSRDITERKNLEERIAMDKLRTEFFANLSHELRTPLNVILGSLQLNDLYIEDDKDNPNYPKYKKTAERMKRNCFRLLRLVNNLIDITRIDSGFYNVELENYDIVTLIKNIVTSVEDYVHNQNIKLRFHSSLEHGVVACDPEKIERILLNLLSNAIKFTDSGGSIEVSIDSDHKDIVIKVKDSGRGIPEEKKESIFERFVQVDKSLTRNHEGSGIGLSLVKALVEMHGGSVEVESTFKKGSAFIIRLPLKYVENCNSNQCKVNNYDSFNIERMFIEFSDIYTK
ncbi:PAS domain S-box protein [Serpentinicella sp. ANB-PHB4]|uniref:PAS domain S-box protein n=1 Tax=Serpentinicella sp. ANB-PHB4 TaxID=3074076 RepID=UPI00285ADBB5|nr:PAS domain S-box protein [Serpentinicella sp. ANB-PHB4]MDR5659656.1 PAS domain S-box protein [Serpentinicella sp. ANB-PHB4]